MLSAKEANKIANSDLLQLMNLIRESAYKRGLSITLDYTVREGTIKVLRDYGYEVKTEEIPIYYETPYGALEDKPSGYKKQTIISWK